MPSGRSRRLGTKHVAGAAYGVDQLVRMPLVDLLAETVDMHVHDIPSRLEIVVPGGLEQHGARNDMAGIPHEQFE